MIQGKHIVQSVLNASKTRMVFPELETMQDILQFGFSFVEMEDEFVAYIIAHPNTIKAILCKYPEAVLDPEGETIGKLWTADLALTKKLKENQIIFSNSRMSTVLLLDVPPNKIK